jgi:acyl-CoA synthetase (AMP-forming)/AMP-acid ligase II
MSARRVVDLKTPLPLLIDAVAEKEGERPFVQQIDGPVHTYDQFHRSALDWAAAFAAAGVGSGDLVATMLPNGMTSYRCWIGLSWLRAIEVSINPQFLGQTLAYPLKHSRAGKCARQTFAPGRPATPASTGDRTRLASLAELRGFDPD